jgi:uncharacterized membrane protein YheB (UPF0754 family)
METFFLWALHHVLRPVFWFQPCFYALHGWLATEMAIWLLFHPYEAKFIPGTRIQIPLTPGILPRGRANLSQSIADTVTRTLLTESDLQQQAEKLITEENIIRCLEAIMDSVEREMQNKEQIRHLYRYGAEVLPGLLSQMSQDLIQNLETEPAGKLHKLLVQILEQGLNTFQPNYPQAELMSDLIFSTLLTPYYIRHLVAEGLTESNIQRIEHGVSRQVGGLKGLLVRFMGIDQTLLKVREFCASNPAEAEDHITEMLDRMEIRERVAERISNFRFAELPPETREAVTGYLSTMAAETLIDHRAEISGLVNAWSGTASRMLINRLLQFSLKKWLNEKHPELKREMARFIMRYLQRELKTLLARALPSLNIGQMIVEKLEQFSNEELEGMIYGICRRELKWLAILGAFLGFWLGLMSNLINFWLQNA